MLGGAEGGNAYFNPRPPRGGRLKKSTKFSDCFLISIHAPREGGDRINFRATGGAVISIHAPREGGDYRH